MIEAPVAVGCLKPVAKVDLGNLAELVVGRARDK